MSRERTFNCRYYDGASWRWLPASGLYRLLRKGDDFLLNRVTEAGVWNLVRPRALTCTCDDYFFSNLPRTSDPQHPPHFCRHLRMILAAVGELGRAIPSVPPHVPSRRGPLTGVQQQNLLDWISEHKKDDPSRVVLP